jgi:hypothetical protein
MYQVVIVLGVVLALAGVAAIAAGAPSWALGLGLGSSLIQSGTMGLVGGLLLFGIGFVLRALSELSRRIDMISAGSGLPSRAAPPAATARAPVKRDAPPRREPPPINPPRDEMEEPAPVDEEDLEFEERPRSRAWPPSTDRQPAEPRGNERGRGPGLEPRLGERERSRPASAEPQLGGRGDFASNNRGDFPGEPRRPRFAPERPKERALEPRGRGGEASGTVVRSGIIHGMAYTLYADGSIEAELPIGTVRFASIEELQDHVSRTGDEADIDFAGKPTS